MHGLLETKQHIPIKQIPLTTNQFSFSTCGGVLRFFFNLILGVEITSCTFKKWMNVKLILGTMIIC